jgi:hypothetical protein
VTHKTTYILDMEYKKMAPGGRALPAGGLVVKQVRQVPSSSRTQTPFLINVPTEFEVYPGEFDTFEVTDVFADHRLKSRWTLQTLSMTLDPDNLNAGLYADVQIEYIDGDQVRTIDMPMALLPAAEHTFDGSEVVDSWQLPELDNPRAYHLHTTGIPTSVPPAQRPLFTPADFGLHAFNVPFKCLTLDVDYDRPVTSWYQQPSGAGVSSGMRSTMRNRVRLWQRMAPQDDDMRQERAFSSGGISITTVFYFPIAPEGDWVRGAGATAPLKRWDHTTIQGLTAEPIVLEGYYSQTYRPEHHNLVENFLFEPRLEPGISPAILSELSEKNVRLIHLILDHYPDDGDQSQISTYGFE